MALPTPSHADLAAYAKVTIERLGLTDGVAQIERAAAVWDRVGNADLARVLRDEATKALRSAQIDPA